MPNETTESWQQQSAWEEIKAWGAAFVFGAFVLPFLYLLLPNAVFFIVAEGFIGEYKAVKIMNYTLCYPWMLWASAIAIWCVYGLNKAFRKGNLR